MNYTAEELLEELWKVFIMLGDENPETYHYLNQLLLSVETN